MNIRALQQVFAWLYKHSRTALASPRFPKTSAKRMTNSHLGLAVIESMVAKIMRSMGSFKQKSFSST
jgi:hypothetical protein